MALDPRQIRKGLLYAAVGLLLVVSGFYLYARYRFRSLAHKLPQKLGVEIQRSSEGFTFSKSENGRTLFTIHAAKTIEYKEGGRAKLYDVNIIVYGKESNRFDQIYGSDFEYDPATGDVVAQGDVQIDLENNTQGPSGPDQAPPQILKNLVHIKTHGLNFNQKSGYAVTQGAVEFRLPQASGTAVGATLDSKSSTLTLQSQVNVTTEGPNPANIVAQHAVLTKVPRQAVLQKPHIAEKQSTFDSDKLTIFLRDDNTVEHMLAEGGLHATEAKPAENKTAPEVYDVRASQGNLTMGERNSLQAAVLHGDVVLDSSGDQPIHATAGTAVIDFAADRRPSKIHATENVHLRQDQPARPGKSAQQLELITDALDLFTGAKGIFQSAVTSGAARIEIQQASSGTANAPKTVVTAGQFNATFDPQGRMRTLHGEPDAKIVSPNPTPHLPDRISTSQALDVLFNSKSNENGIESIVQQGNVHYTDEERQAFSDHARYTPTDQMLNLTGSPRVIDNDKNGARMQTTAVAMRLNRGTGDAFADGEVKTTYNNLKPQPSGAMLSSGDPIHVTARHMTAAKASGVAHYTGDVRLWQGENVVEAPAIDFQRERRSMMAQGTAASQVKSVFVQTDSHGKQSPVHVTSNRLTYADEERKARFEGSVLLTSSDGTMKADRMDLYLTQGTKGAPAVGGQSAGTSASNMQAQMPSQIDHAIAEGNVYLQQPNRNAQGEKLVYTANQSKYVLTGTSSAPPSLFDAERGTVRGDTLTFYSQDDRVLVESSTSVRAVTQTRVK